MPIVQLETEHAPATLKNKLEVAGFSTKNRTNEHVFAVEWDVDTKPALVEALVTFVFVDWCYDYICRRIAAGYDYLNDDEREYIALLTFHGMRKSDDLIDGRTNDQWKEVVQHAIEELFKDAKLQDVYLNLDGLVRFRAKEYLSAIDGGIREYVEQFLVDREYEEFVAMLRYMLDTQPQSGQALHVYCTDDRVWITDAAGELVRDPAVSEAASQATDGAEVNAEDLAMSILITRAPCNIVIHDMSVAAPWPSFAETVEKVFIGRAERCTDCSTCNQLSQNKDSFRPRESKRKVIPEKFD